MLKHGGLAVAGSELTLKQLIYLICQRKIEL